MKDRKVAPRASAGRAGMDWMAVGAHADDVELGAGGTLLRLKALGRRGVIIDLTDASMGTRGTPAIRAREAASSARVLGAERVNLGLPDGRLALDWDSERRLVEAIREYRPKVLITHHWQEEHPDHGVAARLVKRAAFASGFAKLDCPGKPHRPGRIFHFIGEALHEPSFCVDITPHWKDKLRSIACYRSQFHHPGAAAFAGKTDLATPAFLENLEARNRFWGIRVRRRFAEAFVSAELPEVHDITALGLERFP
ncbi:MAG TPA: bacillithiol biosynthesis deacetylase BshB1 [Fibrobacteria bacterium]|nr:bacillithiol biosynthesis deacetylase BshB1 [Fibrobacteria bacterium]